MNKKDLIWELMELKEQDLSGYPMTIYLDTNVLWMKL